MSFIGLVGSLIINLLLGSAELKELPFNERSACVGQALEAPPDYYTIDLVSTKRIPGSGQAVGKGEVSYLSSPFGISLSPDGSYRYKLDVSIDKLRPPKKGHYVVWITTPDIDQVKKVGVLPENHKISGVVEWNKFLVVITLEPEKDEQGEIWTGPIVLRGRF